MAHQLVSLFLELVSPGGGGLAYESDACRKFRIKSLKETNLGLARAFLTSKRPRLNTDKGLML